MSSRRVLLRRGAAVRSAGGLGPGSQGSGGDVIAPMLCVVDVAAVSPPGYPPTEALRADNVVWRRLWSEPGRMVIEFVGIALVEVVDPAGTVTFDRRLPDDLEEHLVLDHVLPLVLARQGELVVHGGVVSLDGEGVILVGATGAGKSTLCAYAWQHGWALGGDDGAVLSATNPPTAEPTYATLRLSTASLELLGLDPTDGSPVAGKRRLAGEGAQAFRRRAVTVSLIAIIDAAEAQARAKLKELDGIDAHAGLFGSTFQVDKRLLPSIIERLGSIVESTTVARLTVPRGLGGLVAAESLLRAHVTGRLQPAPFGD